MISMLKQLWGWCIWLMPILKLLEYSCQWQVFATEKLCCLPLGPPFESVFFIHFVVFCYDVSRYYFCFLDTLYFHVEKSYCLQPDIVLDSNDRGTKICYSMPYCQNYIVTHHAATPDMKNALVWVGLR